MRKNISVLKMLFLCIVLMTLCLLTGCDAESNNSRFVSTDSTDDARLSVYGTFEWISPDGVHYWVVKDYCQYGMSPRYDKNGELVIEGDIK